MSLTLIKPNVKLLWASQGNRAEPTSDKQLEGWVQEIPPHEMENWVQYKQDLAIKYLYQEGIPEWDNSFEYNTTSYVKYNGVIYKLTEDAEVPNTNKQPDIETTSWEIAFEPYGTSSPLAEEIRKIKELEGYLSLYVSKANPFMDGVAVAPEFQASSDGGHTFQGTGANTGMFLNSNNEPEFRINNVVKGKVGNSPSISSSDSTFVTTAMLQEFKTQLFDTVLPVGISIITQDPRNPSEYLGFGSWQRDLEGRALVGVTTDITSASPDWVKSVNQVEGEYNHTMKLSELVPHEHKIEVFRVHGATTDTSINDVIKSSTPQNADFVTEVAGEGQPFNIVQPSKTKFIFTRIL